MLTQRSNYAGIDFTLAEYNSAGIVVIPVAYSQSSEHGNLAQGPEAMLEALQRMSLYDIETNTEVFRNGIAIERLDLKAASAEELCDIIYESVTEHLASEKMVSLIGGDHTLSIAAVRAFLAKYENLTVLQLDAHANLRKSHLGSSLDASCAFHEAAESTNLIQVGIRAMDAAEKPYLKRQNVFFSHEIIKNPLWMDEALELMTRDVYLSIDLDVFDPSAFPSTPYPEPGGLYWDETLKFIRKVSKKRNIVGFELLGLAPHSAKDPSNYFMAKLHYKVLSYIFKKRNPKL